MKNNFKKKLPIIIIVVCIILSGCQKDKNNDNQDKLNQNDFTNITRYAIMNQGQPSEYIIYYYDIEDAIIKIGEDNYDFDGAIQASAITIEELISTMNLKAELNDGGTKIYQNNDFQYFNDKYTLVKCHTVDGNQDIYIGNSDMEFEEHFCKFKTTPGQIKLQNELSKIKDTKKLILRNKESNQIISTITDEFAIKEIIGFITDSREITGPVTSDGTNIVLQMYDSKDKLLNQIYIWRGGSYGFVYDKEYSFHSNFTRLKELLSWPEN